MAQDVLHPRRPEALDLLVREQGGEELGVWHSFLNAIRQLMPLDRRQIGEMLAPT
ncbi:MAG: hypothetical protein U1E17_03025 [Geminicoccaceae bacterium]